MKTLVLFCIFIMFGFNLQAQFFVGSNFNLTNSYTPEIEHTHHFSVPFGINLGYNFNSPIYGRNFNSPIKLELVGFSDKYITINNSEIFFYQLPIILSKTIEHDNLPLSYDLGIIYSTSFIQAREDINANFENTRTFGPGLKYSINFMFPKNNIEIGSLNTYEMFGNKKMKRFSSYFYISIQYYLNKKS